MQLHADKQGLSVSVAVYSFSTRRISKGEKEMKTVSFYVRQEDMALLKSLIHYVGRGNKTEFMRVLIHYMKGEKLN